LQRGTATRRDDAEVVGQERALSAFLKFFFPAGTEGAPASSRPPAPARVRRAARRAGPLPRALPMRRNATVTSNPKII